MISGDRSSSGPIQGPGFEASQRGPVPVVNRGQQPADVQRTHDRVDQWWALLVGSNQRLDQIRTGTLPQNSPHLYVMTTGMEYRLSENPNPGQKLTLGLICDHTFDLIREEQTLLREGRITRDQYDQHVAPLIEAANTMVDARVEKRAHNRLRNFMRTLTGILSFGAIGLPFYAAIKHGDKKFNREIEVLRGRIAPQIREDELARAAIRRTAVEREQRGSQAPDQESSRDLEPAPTREHQIREEELATPDRESPPRMTTILIEESQPQPSSSAVGVAPATDQQAMISTALNHIREGHYAQAADVIEQNYNVPGSYLAHTLRTINDIMKERVKPLGEQKVKLIAMMLVQQIVASDELVRTWAQTPLATEPNTARLFMLGVRNEMPSDGMQRMVDTLIPRTADARIIYQQLIPIVQAVVPLEEPVVRERLEGIA